MASEEEEQEYGAEESSEKKTKSYWWLSLVLIFLLLAGGGYYALTTVSQSAHQLAGGDSYGQLSANNAVYSGKAGAQQGGDFFAADELEPAEAAGVAGAGAGPDKMKASGGWKLSGRDTAAGVSAPAVSGAGEDEAGAENAAVSRDGETLEARLQAKAQGPRSGPGAQASRSSVNSHSEAFKDGGPAAGKPSVQRETSAAAPKKAAKGGVLDALKGAFRASFYGARIASHDSAKSWIARSFDASPEASMAIEYDEKMRAKLDRIDPNSIPKFLREQDVSAAEAKTLATSDVGKPQLDVEGTKEALKNDKDYQAKKLAKDMAAGAINPMGGMFESGDSRNGGDEDEAGKNRNGGAGFTGFASPEDEAAFGQVQLDDYISTNGYGAECGCTAAAPCCCMPENTATSNCPMYGPFLPNDPCGGYTTGLTGDFTPNTSGMLPA